MMSPLPMTAILGRGEDNAERRFELRDLSKSPAEEVGSSLRPVENVNKAASPVRAAVRRPGRSMAERLVQWPTLTD